MPKRPVYLDCNATTPIDEEVLAAMSHYFRVEFGNAGSRSHSYGSAAAKAVRHAREQVATVVNTSWENVVFTSGATESNNLAILGAAPQAAKQGRKHIISTQIEHKAVLEPIAELAKIGFDVTLIPPTGDGIIEPSAVAAALRTDTFLVSVMQANNETGVIQPLEAIAAEMVNHPAYLHTDAAQGFGKQLDSLRLDRIDLISISGHKVFGPKGVGALVVRREATRGLRLEPLMFGGGQERGYRPGTLPVPLVVGIGLAAEIAVRDHAGRRAKCLAFRQHMLEGLASLEPTITGQPDALMPHVLNLRFGSLDSEAVMLVLKDLVAISNGSACTSDSYEPSHVLTAMGLSRDEAQLATRWSWSHMTATPDWPAVVRELKMLQ